MSRLLLPLLILGGTLPAAAQQSICPEGNLLASKPPTNLVGVSRASRLTDGRAPAEGDIWNSANVALLRDGESYAEWDLGGLVQLGAAWLQGDNNDTYSVQVSEDGETFVTAWLAPMAEGAGMRTRKIASLDVAARYVRVGFGSGDTFYSLGGVQLFCGKPATWPPRVIREKSTQRKERGWNRQTKLSLSKIVLGVLGLIVFLGLLWDRFVQHKRRWHIVTGAAALALGFAAFMTYDVAGMVGVALATLGWLVFLNKKREAKKPTTDWTVWAERGALIAMLVAAGHTWINFASFHGPRTVHLWDSMHYYMGSKYFKENRYNLYYSCAAVADAEDGRREEVLERKFRDLKDNRLGTGEMVLAYTAECKSNFTPERWEAFKQDLRVFRELMSTSWYKDSFKDHGYNATPPWTMVGQVLSNWDWRSEVPPPQLANSPLNTEGKDREQLAAIRARFKEDRERLSDTVNRIAFIDFSLYAGIFLMLWWAFGLRAAAFAAVIWGVGHPWAYYWTGGGFGRVPWLFMAVAGFCLVKKQRPMLGAFAITWSALLRVFPAALAGGIVLKMLYNAYHRKLTKPHMWMIVGGTLALMTLIPLSLPASGGFSAYPEFLQNSFKHRSTPLTNHMGLPTIMSWHPSHAARMTKSNRTEDPFAYWKELRQDNQHSRRVLFWGILIALFVGVGWAGRELEDWQVTSLSTVFVVSLFELTCYYYNFLVILAPLALLRPRYLVTLFAMVIGTQIASLSIGWFDELYVMESFLVFAGIVYILVDMILQQRRAQTNASETNASETTASETTTAAARATQAGS